MPHAARSRTATLPMPLGTTASVLLHLGLGLLLVFVSLQRPLPVPPPPQPIAVQLLSPDQFASLGQPAARPELAAPPAPGPAPAEPAPQRKSGGTISATQFYASGILKEPGMQKIKASLEGFADADRVMQLCNIESLEQIRRADPSQDPDIMVSYAMADVTQRGLTLIATGGAYRSRRKWYGIQFRCTATPDLEGVSEFTFRLGAAIPEDQWEAHDLTAEDPDLD